MGMKSADGSESQRVAYPLSRFQMKSEPCWNKTHPASRKPPTPGCRRRRIFIRIYIPLQWFQDMVEGVIAMKPRSLMFTLFGDYIQYYGGEIWIGSLIRLMDVFGISEQSVRGATFRMVNQDLLQVRRVGNRSYYSLTAKGKRNVIDGVKRVYSINNHKWDRL